MTDGITTLYGPVCVFYRLRIRAIVTVACLRQKFRYDPEAIYENCVIGLQQLWTDGTTWCIVEPMERVDGRVLWIAFAAGRLFPALSCYRKVEAEARRQGYDAIAFEGRRGWTRVLRGFERHDDDGWIKRLH